MINFSTTEVKKQDKYISFEIPRKNIIVESKDKLLILIDENMDTVFWVDKKQCSNLNQYKLSFNISFNMEPYKGVDQYITIIKKKVKDSIGKISPNELCKYFRKVG